MSVFCSQTMWVFQSFLLVLFVRYVFGLQNQYTVLQENLVLSNIDHKAIEATAGVFQINDTTNGLNFTFTLKVTLPRDSKFATTALKWINGDYRLGLVNLYNSIPSALEMEMFDLQALVLDYCRPVLVWPLVKGVCYRCVGWSPDSTKFPPNLPGGRWKVPISFMFGNNTKFIVANWYLKLTYKN